MNVKKERLGTNDASLTLPININFHLIVLFLLVIAMPSYATLSDNLRLSVDASARLNQNIATDNTSRIYALGIDSHQVFTNKKSDVGYAVAQLYLTKLSNQSPYSFLFDSPDDHKLIIREAHLNYTAVPAWMPNIRIGHFTLPFGLEESIDTNGRLLDYHHGKNLGTKLDWGLSLNKITSNLEYNISYTMGGKDDPKIVDDSYIYTGRLGSLEHHDFIAGLSFFNAKIDNIARRRYAIDLQYYWLTWGLLTEFSIEKKRISSQISQQEKYALIELNKTSINGQLKLYGQYSFTHKQAMLKNLHLINIGLSYQVNTSLDVSVAVRRQLSSISTSSKQHLVRAQIRYRY